MMGKKKAKNFFFEKKQQKTFVRLARQGDRHARPRTMPRLFRVALTRANTRIGGNHRAHHTSKKAAPASDSQNLALPRAKRRRKRPPRTYAPAVRNMPW
jgi:hypothetical protein